MTQPKRKPEMSTGPRRIAYVCYQCQPIPHREFFTVEPPRPPKCEKHGPMVRQKNQPYFGRSTE